MRGGEVVKAQDNVLFFKNLKFQLEQGAGLGLSTGLASASGAHTGGSLQSAVKRSASGTISLPDVAAASPAAALKSSASMNMGLTSKVGATGAAAAAAAGAADAAKAAPKSQMAVKQFFRSLLNNNPKPGK